MTTPQNELFNMANRLNYLIKRFEDEEDDLDYFDYVKQLYTMQKDIFKCMEILKDQMALIIKLLGKNGK